MKRMIGLMSAFFMLGQAALWAAEVNPELLAGMAARSIGPAGMSGRVAAIEAAGSDPDVVYVGAASGGVWKSTNGGLSFRPIFDEQPLASIGAIAVHPSNPDIVWVGTGEGNVRNSVSVGNGVYRSMDGGETWTHLGLEATERIYRIVLHPQDPDVAWVAALGPLWSEGGRRGVFKTENGGEAWKKVLYVDERTGASDLVMDPQNPKKLYASMWQFRRWPYFFRSGGPGSGLYVSVDGGEKWKKLQEEDGLPKGDLGRIAVAIAASEPSTVYALVEAETSALLRSKDGGKSWQSVNERFDIAPRPFYFCDLRVDPKNPLRVYNIEYTIQVSEDSGKSFRTLIPWNQLHGDYHALWIDPADPKHMYVGNDGGIGVSRDGGRSVQFVSTLPLAQFYHVAVDMEQPYNVYGGLQDNGSWRGPSAVWQSGGIRNHHWQVAGGGDGFETKPDPVDPQQVYALWQGGNLYRSNLRTGEARHLKPLPPEGVALRYNWNAALAIDPHDGSIYLGSQFVHRSADRGETWATISGDLTTNNPQWEKQADSGGLTKDVTAAENHCSIFTLAPSPVQKGVLWAGTDDGRIQVTQDGGASWSSVELNVVGMPQNAWVSHIEASSYAAGTAFVTVDDHRRGDPSPYVFRTEDFGKTWTPLVTVDLKGYAHVIRQDPVQPKLLFLGTELGLWVTLDGGAGWFRWKHGVPPAPVYGLAVHPREHDLVIATHGRAVYVLDDIRPLRSLSAETMREPMHLFDIAAAQQHRQLAQDGGFGLGTGEFRGENRPYGAILTYSLNSDELPLPDEKKERKRKEAQRKEERKEAALQWGPFASMVPAPPVPAADPNAALDPNAAADPNAVLDPNAPKKPAPAGKDKPKVEIRITDAAGVTLRTFKADAKQGLNRAVWDLGRDAFKDMPRAEPPEPDEEEAGPEVPPGTYGVVVKYGQHEAKGSVQVLADPRGSTIQREWQERWAALMELGRMREAIVGAVERVRKTREDVGIIEAKVREANRELAKADPAKLEELPLLVAAAELNKALGELEGKLWTPFDSKGIVEDKDVWSQLGYVWGYVEESSSPPSPTHRAHIARVRKQLEAALAEVNGFLDSKVAAFRKQAMEAPISLLQSEPPLQMPPK